METPDSPNVRDDRVTLVIDLLARMNAVTPSVYEAELPMLLAAMGSGLDLDWVTYWDRVENDDAFVRAASWKSAAQADRQWPNPKGMLTLKNVREAGIINGDPLIEIADFSALGADHPYRGVVGDDQDGALLFAVRMRNNQPSGGLVFGVRGPSRPWVETDRSFCKLLAQAMESLSLRIEAERRSDRHRALYRDYLANSEAAIWCWRFDPPLDFEAPLEVVAPRLVNAPYVEVNAAYCRARGHAPEAVVGHTWMDLYARDDPDAFQRYLGFLQRYMRRDGYLYESQVDKRIYKVLIYREVIDGLTHHLWGTMTDVTELESACRELATSEERLKAWIDHSEDLLACLEYRPRDSHLLAPSADDWSHAKVLECTDSFARAFELPGRTALIGSRLDLARSPFDPSQIGAILERFVRSGFADVEDVVERVRDVAEPQWYQVRVQGVRDPSDNLVQVWLSFKNRTEEVLATRELEQSQERVRQLMRGTSDARLCLDLQHPVAPGQSRQQAKAAVLDAVVVECSDNFAHSANLEDRDAAIGRRFSELRLDPASGWLDHIVNLLRSGASRSPDFDFDLTSSGESLTTVLRQGLELISDTFGARQIWLTSRDVTEEVRGRRALEGSERLRTLAMSAAHLNLWDYSSNAGLNLAWSERVILGLPESEPLSIQQLMALIVPEDRHHFSEAFRSFAVEHSASLHAEVTIKRAHGEGRIIEFWGTALNRSDDGVLRQAAGVFRDVTDARVMERRMLNSQKLGSLGVMAGGIAHDFNNLLTAIIGNAELGMFGLAEDSPAARAISEIERAAQRAAELCQHLLAYAGESVPRREVIDLVGLVEELSQLLAVSVSKQCQLQITHREPQLGVRADNAQLQQVVMNLIVNASEALGSRGGTVGISTHHTNVNDDGSSVDTNLLQPLTPGRYAVLEVRDDGSGMTAATRERMFDPFFSTKFAGRGLGMASVLGIIGAHEGGISVFSEEDAGTRIRVYLPAADLSLAPDLSTEDPLPLAGAGAGGRVLVVDDEDAVRDVAMRMVGRLGFDTLGVPSGEAALAMLDSNSNDISLVLLDLSMPGMGGAAAARIMLARHPNTRILLSSGYAAEGLPQDLVAQGIHFLQKPYSIQGILTALSGIDLTHG